MTRLTHSPQGFIRALQISRASICAFVEGGLDRPFFERVIRAATGNGPHSYQVIAAKELPGGTGGKNVLLDWFLILRKRNLLMSKFMGKSLGLVFFCDKDVDDLAGKKYRSNHLVYTKTYDIEAHLLLCGDLTAAIADAAFITRVQVFNIVGDPLSWIKKRAEHLAEWVTLCAVSKYFSLDCGCTFDRQSDVNPDCFSSPDPDRVVKWRRALAIASASDRFDFVYEAIRRKVGESTHSANFLKFVKGKWINIILQKHFDANRVPDANMNGLADRVLSVLVSQLCSGDRCPCSKDFLASVKKIVADPRMICA